MIPSNPKIGDRFVDRVEREVIGFDYEGRIVSKVVGAIAPTPIEIKVEEKKTEVVGEDYESMSIKALQNICKEKGLTIRGSKAEVIERIKGAK